MLLIDEGAKITYDSSEMLLFLFKRPLLILYSELQCLKICLQGNTAVLYVTEMQDFFFLTLTVECRCNPHRKREEKTA